MKRILLCLSLFCWLIPLSARELTFREESGDSDFVIAAGGRVDLHTLAQASSWESPLVFKGSWEETKTGLVFSVSLADRIEKLSATD